MFISAFLENPHTNDIARFEKLYAEGANIHEKNANNSSFLTLAVFHQNFAIAQFALSHYANPNGNKKGKNSPLIYAVSQKNYRMTKLLLDYHANPNKPQKNSAKTPLEVAVNNDSLDIVTLLLEKGANPDSAVKSKFYRTSPLIIAVNNQQLEMVELLLKAKADPNLKNNVGFFPLMFAVFKDNEKMIDLLVRYHADIHQKLETDLGIVCTPVSFAKEYYGPNSLKYFYRNYDVIKSSANISPLSLAVNEGDSLMVELLMDGYASRQYPREDAASTLLWLAFNFRFDDYYAIQEKNFLQTEWNPNKRFISAKYFSRYLHQMYGIHNDGVCLGTALMGMQAILCDDLAAFDKHVLTFHCFYIIQLLSRKISYPLVLESELPIFLDGMALYQHPEDFEEMFAFRPLVQNSSLVMPWLTPIKLEEKGGVRLIGSFNGIYSISELQSCLKLFSESIDKLLLHPSTNPSAIAFVLKRMGHAFAAGYLIAQKQWVFIGTSQLPTQYFKTEKELIKCIWIELGCITTLETNLISTHIYSTKQDETFVKEVFSECSKDKMWQDIHAVTPAKAVCSLNGFNWLMMACLEGDFEKSQTLIQHGADINHMQKNERTVLHLAIQNANRDIVELLLKSGANANPSTISTSPLMHAIHLLHTDIVRLLIAYNADPNYINSSKDSILHDVINMNYEEVLDDILKAGADPLTKNSKGQTCIALAKEKNLPSMVKKLKAQLAKNPPKPMPLSPKKISKKPTFFMPAKTVNNQFISAFLENPHPTDIERFEKLYAEGGIS